MTRGDLRATVDRLHDLMIGVEPDLTLLIDIDPALGLSRAVAAQGSEQRFEDMGLAMQARMRAAFLALAAQFPARFVVIDGGTCPHDRGRGRGTCRPPAARHRLMARAAR